MNKLNSNIIIFFIVVLILLLSYWKVFRRAKGVYKISGFLLFKYIYRLIAALIFIYLISNKEETKFSENNNKNTTIYVINESHLNQQELVFNFKNLITNDLKNHLNQTNNSYSIAKFDTKNHILLKILPDLKPNQLIVVLENNSLNFSNTFSQKLQFPVGFERLINSSDFYKFKLNNNTLLFLDENDRSEIELGHFNNFNIVFNLKLYLVFLLIVTFSVDVLISLKIIKI
jgi:hypothetical protein